MSNPRNQSPTMFDHLETLYNQQARQHYLAQQHQKQLYHKLIEAENAQKLQQREHYKLLNKLDNERIDQFWKNEEEKRRQVERKRKQLIDQTRKVNSHIAQSTPTSLYPQQPPIDHYNIFLQSERQRKKAQKQAYLQQYNYYADLKKIATQNQKQQDLSIAKAKQQEQHIITIKRDEDLRRIKNKHQQDIGSYLDLDQILRKKQQQKQALDNYIVNQGAQEIQSRLINQAQINDHYNKSLKNSFISELKSQLSEGQQKQKIQRRNSLQMERQAIKNRNRYLEQLDNLQKNRKKEQNKNHLQVLKHQFKPRNLLPQKTTLEDAGIGSPVHIGKIFNDDRRKQLQWIQKNLFKQLSIK